MTDGSFKIPGDLPDDSQPTTAVGFLGGDTRDEFPVLKAFQEYIDAEQAKARKRMLGLSAFFIVLLTMFTITFVVVLGWLIQRNQKLEDRIFDMTEKERDRSAEQSRLLAERTEAARRAGQEAATAAVNAAARTVQQQPLQNTAEMLKPLLERIERERAEMKAALEEEKRRLAEDSVRREREAEIVREADARKRAAEEKERERQEEIERHRRRLYPEYYSRLEAGHAPSLVVKPRTSAQKPLGTLKPVTYFTDDSEPVAIEKTIRNPEIKAARQSRLKKKYTTIDVKSEGDDVPFIIELPEEK